MLPLRVPKLPAPADDPYRDSDVPVFHVAPHRGWGSDPHGPIRWKGRYHIFNQGQPMSCQWWWGMRWEHYVSEDLVHWTRLPPALIPTPGGLDADGCFTGNIVLHPSGVPMLFYTGARLRHNPLLQHPDPPEHARNPLMFHWETQLCAVADPDDELLIHWRKVVTPWMALPHCAYLSAWRDPFFVAPVLDPATGKPAITDGRAPDGSHNEPHMMIIGSGLEGLGGTALIYRSNDLAQGWRFTGYLATWPTLDTGLCWECPHLLNLPDLPDGLHCLASKTNKALLPDYSSITGTSKDGSFKLTLSAQRLAEMAKEAMQQYERQQALVRADSATTAITGAANTTQQAEERDGSRSARLRSSSRAASPLPEAATPTAGTPPAAVVLEHLQSLPRIHEAPSGGGAAAGQGTAPSSRAVSPMPSLAIPHQHSDQGQPTVAQHAESLMLSSLLDGPATVPPPGVDGQEEEAPGPRSPSPSAPLPSLPGGKRPKPIVTNISFADLLPAGQPSPSAVSSATTPSSPFAAQAVTEPTFDEGGPQLQDDAAALAAAAINEISAQRQRHAAAVVTAASALMLSRAPSESDDTKVGTMRRITEQDGVLAESGLPAGVTVEELANATGLSQPGAQLLAQIVAGRQDGMAEMLATVSDPGLMSLPGSVPATPGGYSRGSSVFQTMEGARIAVAVAEGQQAASAPEGGTLSRRVSGIASLQLTPETAGQVADAVQSVTESAALSTLDAKGASEAGLGALGWVGVLSSQPPHQGVGPGPAGSAAVSQSLASLGTRPLDKTVTPEEKELQMVASLPLVQAIVAQSQRLSTPPQEEMQKLRASPSPEMNGSAEMHGGAVAPEPAGPLPPSKSVSRRSTAGGAGHEGDGTALVTIAGPEKKVLPVPPKLTPGVNTLEEIRAACRAYHEAAAAVQGYDLGMPPVDSDVVKRVKVGPPPIAPAAPPSQRWFLGFAPDAATYGILYFLGEMRDEHFHLESATGPAKLDLGNTLYAPLAWYDEKHGRHLVWGYIKELRTIPPPPCVCNKFTQSGCLSLPRALYLRGGKLFQVPVPELALLRSGIRWSTTDTVLDPASPLVVPGPQEGGVGGARLDIELVVKNTGATRTVLLLDSWRPGGKGAAALVFDWAKQCLEVVFDAHCFPYRWRDSDAGPADGCANDIVLHARHDLVMPGGCHTISDEDGADYQVHVDNVVPPVPDMNPSVPDWIRMKHREAGGQLDMAPGQDLELRIFIDGSAVEVFTGTGQALTTRIYRGTPTTPEQIHPDSQPVSPYDASPKLQLLSTGGTCQISVEVHEVHEAWLRPEDVPLPPPVDEASLARWEAAGYVNNNNNDTSNMNGTN